MVAWQTPPTAATPELKYPGGQLCPPFAHQHTLALREARPAQHCSAILASCSGSHFSLLQVAGEAVYTEDMATPPGTLHAALVTSHLPRGRIVSIDPAPATALPGVHGYFGAKDVPGSNRIGVVFKDEYVFAEEEVTCVGQPIGIMVADSPAVAKRAAALVKVRIRSALQVVSDFPGERTSRCSQPLHHRVVKASGVAGRN